MRAEKKWFQAAYKWKEERKRVTRLHLFNSRKRRQRDWRGMSTCLVHSLHLPSEHTGPETLDDFLLTQSELAVPDTFPQGDL